MYLENIQLKILFLLLSIVRSWFPTASTESISDTWTINPDRESTFDWWTRMPRSTFRPWTYPWTDPSTYWPWTYLTSPIIDTPYTLDPSGNQKKCIS